MAELDVRLVASDRQIWQGPATYVLARTLEGEIGILPSHEPVLALLDDGLVKINLAEGGELRAAVHRGFLSVSGEEVAILAHTAELAGDIDVARAEAALGRAQQAAANDEAAAEAMRRAEVRLEVAQAPRH